MTRDACPRALLEARNGGGATQGSQRADWVPGPRRKGLARSHAKGNVTGHELHFLWPRHDLLSVQTATSSWLLSPSTALVVPGGLPYAVAGRGVTELLRLRLPPLEPVVGTSQPTRVVMNGLGREAVTRLCDPNLDARARSHLLDVVLDLMHGPPQPGPGLVTPLDGRLVAITRGILENPADLRTLSQWGHEVGASARTLSRLFPAETGATFSEWRTRVRLEWAAERLRSGRAVAAVAREAGYASPSAFAYAFRRATGLTPREVARDSGGE